MYMYGERDKDMYMDMNDVDVVRRIHDSTTTQLKLPFLLPNFALRNSLTGTRNRYEARLYVTVPEETDRQTTVSAEA